VTAAFVADELGLRHRAMDGSRLRPERKPDGLASGQLAYHYLSVCPSPCGTTLAWSIDHEPWVICKGWPGTTSRARYACARCLEAIDWKSGTRPSWAAPSRLGGPQSLAWADGSFLAAAFRRWSDMYDAS
jgi:hypothetical protein